MDDPEAAARASLRRSMLIYAALVAGDVLILSYIAGSGASGAAYVSFSIVALVGLLLAYHVWQHIRDLGTPLAETEGILLRKWDRADLIIAWHSYYINVDRAIFRVPPLDYRLLNEGMRVTVTHFARTHTVVSIQEIRGAPPTT